MPLDTIHSSKAAIDKVPVLGMPTSTTALGITDWNNLVTPGHSQQLMLGSLTNGPGDSNYYYVEVRIYAGTEIAQIGHQYAQGAGRPMLIQRDRISNVWGSWRRVFSIEDVPAFSVFSQHGSGTGPSGVQVWTNVATNIGSYYNTANGRFTAPFTGRYAIKGSTLSASAGSSVNCYLRVNGAVVQYSEDSQTGTSGFGMANVVNLALPLNTGDYVDLQTTVAHYGNVYANFSGHLIT